jgi:hypothetical protein
MESFLKEVTNQIRSKKVKKNVEKELRNHLISTKNYWIEKGLNERDAEEEAIKKMGSSIKLGNEFDDLYNPRFTLLLKPLFIHIIISIFASILFNIVGSFDTLMINDFSRKLLYGFETLIIILLYFILANKFLKNISSNLLLKSISIILIINLCLGLSGLLMLNFGTNTFAESGQLPILLLMAFNYGFFPFISMPIIPDVLGVLILCLLSPLLLFIGSYFRKNIFIKEF